METIESPKIKSWEPILKEAEQLYQRLEYEGQWNPRAKKGSVFKTTTTTTATSTTNGDPVAFPATKGGGKKAHDRKGNPIDRNPPKAGAPKERKKGDTTEHWCEHEKCGRWGNHPTEKHGEWWDKHQKSREKFRDRRRGGGRNTNAPPTEIHPSALPVTNANSTQQQQQRLRFAATAVSTNSANF